MKKLFSLLSLIVLALASSVIFISCGDDYKNMYLEIQYAEWTKTDGGRIGEWKTVDPSKGLDFVLSEDNKRGDYYDLRMKVLVKGTKKDVDFVSVSCTGSSSLQLDVSTVKNEQEFVVKVFTTGSANMFFTPSVKSDKKAISFPINLYDELKSVSQNKDYFPAIVKGGELNLNELTDLIIYDGANGWTTNQRGVVFSMDNADNQDGLYTLDDGNGHTCALDTRSNANILKIAKDYMASSITLKATSVYSGKTTTKEEIATDIIVKIVDNIDSNRFLVNYASRFDKEFSNNNLDTSKVSTLNLYPNNAGYNSTNLVLSGMFDNSIYGFENVEDVQFETRVLVDGVDVTDKAEAYHGLKISQDTSMTTANGVELNKKLNQVFLVEATTYLQSTTNTLQFVVGVKNLRFTSPIKNYNINSSLLTYTIKVTRESLPQSVTINDNPYVDGASFSQYIYSDYGNLSGLNLRVNANTSTQKATDIKITAYTTKSGNTKTYDGSVRALNFYSYNGILLGGANSAVNLKDSYNSIYAKFAEGINSYPKTIYVDFEILASPLKFDGVDVTGDKQYITVTMTLNTIGKIATVSSTSDSGAYDLFGGSTNRMLEAGKGIKSNLNLSSGSEVLVDYSTAKLKSKNGNIKFSNDNINFVNELNCGELINKIWYFKAENNQEDQVILETDLGQVWKSSNLMFVNTTAQANPNIKLYTKNSNLVKLGSVINYEGENTGTADFYAMQFNTTADFYAGYGANNNFRGITSISVGALPNKENITNYGVDVFGIQKFDNGYSFNLNAKRTDLTSAIKVVVNYYVGNDYAVELKSQTLYLEIASYRPVSNLLLNVSNKEIYYVNQLITDKATTEIVANFDDNATRVLSFSDNEINKKVNSATKSQKQSLYFVEVNNEVAQNINNEIEQTGLIDEKYLDLNVGKYTIKLTKQLDSISNITIQFKVVSYALDISKSFNVNIVISDFVRVQDIEIKNTAQNNNIFLSLQYNEKKTASFEAKASNSDATYKYLDYQLFKFDEKNASGNYIGERVVSNDIIKVEYDESLKKFNLEATSNVGGKFVLKIVSLDSFNNFTKDYDVHKFVVITISDGSENNPYYLYNSTDIANIQNGLDKHYIVANSIDLKDITKTIAGTFTGSIDGIIVSYNASTGIASSYSQSYLSNLNISDECTSLFEINAGTIKNIVLNNTKFNLNLSGFQNNVKANVGALVGENNGKIVNCSTSISVEGTINIDRTNESTSAEEYNIGALIGRNNGEVYFYDINNNALKIYTDCRQMAVFNKKLVVTLNSVGSATQINVGGAIGKNTGSFVGNYYDFNQNETEYLTVQSNVELHINSQSEYFSVDYIANVGGFVGNNEGTISQLAVKGNIVGAGSNVNVGGIAGCSSNNVENSATFSCFVYGQAFEKAGEKQTEIKNQNVGGAVGYSSGNINNVYVLFIMNTNNDTQFGGIKGVDVVGGLVGCMNSGEIIVGNVQSFVDDYCIVGEYAQNQAITDVQKSVGGLVGYYEGGNIGLSYAKVNIATDIGNVSSLANNATIENSFFIGAIKGADGLITINSNENVYSLVKGYSLIDDTTGLIVAYFGKLFYNGESKAYYYYDSDQQKELWTTTVPTVEAGNIKLESPIEAIDFSVLTAVGWSQDSTIWTEEYKKYNSGLPVIMNDGNPTLLALAETLIVKVNDEYFDDKKDEDKEDLKIYHNDNGIFFAKGTTSDGKFVANESTAIVFLNHKTYNLVSQNGNEGLIYLEVLPNIASSSYRVNIISGSDVVAILGNYITFKKAGRVELEFVSTFNPNAKDRVVIFAIEPMNSLEINSENFVGDNLSMFTNSTALVSLLAQFGNGSSDIDKDYLYLDFAIYKKAENFVAGTDYYYYDSDKKSYAMYGKNGAISIDNMAIFNANKNNIYIVDNATNGLNLLPLGDQIIVGTKTYYSFADLQLKLDNFANNNQKLSLTINCYLDLSKFVYSLGGNLVDEKTLRDLFDVEYKLTSNTINLTLCQRAQSITSNLTDTKVATSQSVQFDIEVLTGYIDINDTTPSVATTIINNQLLQLNIDKKESVNATVDGNTEYLEKYNLSSLWELFNISVSYVLNDTNTGYKFTYILELKDEYKAILDDEEFVFEFYPITNDNISKQIKATFEPQSITTLRMENYKSGVATVVAGQDNIVEYTSSEVQSSIIVPGKSGLIKIFVEPTFARVDELNISSSEVTVSGKTYTVKFQQMLYDQNKGHYVSYMGYTSGSDNLRLVKNTYIDTDGNKHYTGVIYVRTVLENAVAIKETFTLTVTAKEYQRENGAILDTVKTEKVATKMLVTQFNPGLYVTSNGMETSKGVDSVYLVEKSSNQYKIYATIKGYEINQNPQLQMSNYYATMSDADFNAFIAGFSDPQKEIAKNLRKAEISDYISYVQGAVIPQSNGDYVITWDLKINELSVPVVFKISISLITEDMLLETKEESITMYPVDYLPTSVSLRGTANNVLRVGVNSQKTLELIWKSGDTELNSDEITKSLGTYDQDGKLTANYLQFFYLTSYDTIGQIKEENWKVGTYKSNNSDIYQLDYNDELKKYFVKALGEAYVNVNFGVKYAFEYDNTTDQYKIKFYTHNDTDHSGKVLNFSFYLDMRVETSEEEPDPIYTVEDLMNVTDGGNYILMNNLTLTDWTPITAQIASLDGNNKIIKIKNFQVATSGEIYAGLFATIGENCIIKNLTIDISEFTVDMDTDGNYVVMLADANTQITATYFGFIAGQNNGLIYNSELINTSSAEIKINVKTSSTNSYIGGLVGQNNGNITNSRVGTPYYLQLLVNNKGVVSEGTTTNTGTITLKASGIVGGFAGINSGIISSSYFQNANLVNYNTVANDTYNKTGGFVAINTGSIYNSYTKGKGRNSTTARGSETSIFATHAGSASGFVFENSGTIENCYSNIFVQSSSSAVAGFVYRNNATGKINRSYSAGKVSSKNTNNALATELPFVGVGIDGTEVNKLLSYGELNNCFYLEIAGDNFDDNFEYDEDMDLPIGLDDTNFADSENLLNFAFVDGNYEQSTKGVWTYFSNLDNRDVTTSNLGKTFLPELTSANQISRSIRYIIPSQEEDERNHYAYGSSYELGSKNNPYIIRNYNEYNSVFSISTFTNSNVIAGYIRLINNIDFVIDAVTNTTATVNTTNGYDLGDKLNSTLTVFDGNGMTISGVDIKNYETQALTSLGLFSNIYNAVIKSLSVEYVAMDYTSTQATYSGGLAGTITDSSIIDVNILGNNTTITARNFGGGVAGLVTGKTMLYNVSSNVNVKVTYASPSEPQQYVSKDDFAIMYAKLGYTSPSNYDEFVKKLSYAGGIAGVIDVYSSKANFTNVNKLVVGETGSTSVTADIAGFVAGYLGKNVSAKRLKSFMGGSSYVFGAYISGGLVGENYATIGYSQVASLQTTQENIDSAFANYILSEKNTPTSTPIGDNTQFGNLHFVRGESIDSNIESVAGGFIGINYNASIHNSYSKASIDANAKYVGGFVGITVGGGYESCYSQNYFDILNKDRLKYVGGFVGYNRALTTNGITKVASSIIQKDDCKMDNIVVASFYDKSQLEYYVQNYDATSSAHLDYVVAISDNTIASAQGSGTKSIYTFYLSYEEMGEASYFRKAIQKNTLDKNNDKYDLQAEVKAINKLYDLTDEKQLETYTSLFTNFNAEIWKKDHTIYTPYLLENLSLNYYQIRTEADLNLINLHPNGNFEVMGDIALSSAKFDYVIETEFTGTLRGKLSATGEIPRISGIKINTKNETSAGFFAKTNGARISNLTFVYNYMYIEDKKDYVGLLSADEQKSEITGVTVSVDNSNKVTNKNGNIFDDANIATADKISIKQFGGLFGNSKSTVCTSTNVSLGNYVRLNGAGESSSFGIFAGSALGESTLNVDSMFMNCKGYTKLSTLGLNLNDFKYVGGAIGYAQNVNLNTINISSNDKPIKIVNTNNSFVGGLLGYQLNSYISNSKVYVEVMDKKESLSSTKTIKIGGVSGYVQNDGIDKDADIYNTYAKLILAPEINNKEIVENKNIVSIGGLVGATKSNLKLDDVVAWTTGTIVEQTIYFGGLIGELDNNLVSISNAYSYNGGDDYELNDYSNNEAGIILKANNVTAGGLLGWNNANEATIAIDNSFVNGAIFVKSKDVGESKTLHLGGLIGSWYKLDEKGKDLPNNYANSVTLPNGNIYSTHINNVYTTFALEYSQFQLNNGTNLTLADSWQNSYCVGAIVGRVSNATDTTKLAVSGLIYSSDFVLAVEEKDIFSSTPINVTAEVLLNDQCKKQYFSTDNGWTIYGFRLPYKTSLSSKMEELKDNKTLLSRFGNDGDGSAVKPIVIDPDSNNNYIFNKTTYKYYFVNSGVSSYVDSTQKINKNVTPLNLFGQLVGFVLGNGKTILVDTKESTNNMTMAESSVVSNLNIQLKYINKMSNSGSHGVIADVNNGTIFNCQVDFYFNGKQETSGNVYGGAIAGVNQGNILYCYASATIENAGTISYGGITMSNQGLIYASGAVGLVTGGVTGNGIAGIACSNQGTIYNTFSAVSCGNSSSSGDTPSTVFNKNTGYAEKCYYDQYANNEIADIKDKDGKTKLVEHLSTKALQTNYQQYLLGNWNNYMMREIVKDEDGNIVSEKQCDYFNYGYPIYLIPQYWFDTGDAVLGVRTITDSAQIVKRGIFTGNGTKENPYLLINAGTMESINSFDNTTAKYFKLINDIKFTPNARNSGLLENWIGLGGSVSENSNYFKHENTGAFKGNFVSGDRFVTDWIREDIIAPLEETVRTITDVNDIPLFTTISSGFSNDIKAVVSSLIFKNETGKTGSSVLAQSIAGGLIEVSNLEFTGQYTLTGDNVGLVASAINVQTDENGTTMSGVSINNIKINEAKCDVSATVFGVIVGRQISNSVLYNNISITNGEYGYKDDKSSAGSVGGVLGELAGGQFSLDESEISGVTFGAKVNVGSIIGMMSSGSVAISAKKIGTSANKLAIFGGSGSMGGFVGLLEDGQIVIEGDGSSNFELGIKVAETDRVASNTGGIVGTMNGGSIIGGGATTISIEIIRAISNAGGLVGQMSSGEITGFEVQFNSKSENDNYASCFGGLVGQMKDGTIGGLEDETAQKIAIKSDGFELTSAQKLGGLAGMVAKGSFINIEMSIKSINAKKGNTKVSTTEDSGMGGLVGVVGTIGEKAEGEEEQTSSISLASIKSEGEMTISTDGTITNVGGLFGLLKTNLISGANIDTAESNKDGIDIKSLKVRGVKNVGGFVGQYAFEGALSISENFEKYIGESTDNNAGGSGEESGYATILLPESGDDVELNVTQDTGNFGGLFGYYNSKTQMGYAIGKEVEEGAQDDKEKELKPFVNYNKVLVYTDEEIPEEFTLNKIFNYQEVKNIGGIAGFTMSKLIGGTNNAEVGSIGNNTPETLNMESFTGADFRSKTIRSINVGGIVGSLNETENVQFAELTNKKDVKGNENVGGIIGLLKIDADITTSFDGKINKQSNVVGINNVGGLIGNSLGAQYELKFKEGGEDSQECSISINGNVNGRTNVGGVIGSIRNTANTVSIGDIDINVDVSGLINVGGIIGGIQNTNINLINTSPSEGKTPSGKYKLNVTGNTNLGGFVGNSMQSTEILRISNFDAKMVKSIKVKPVEYSYGKVEDPDDKSKRIDVYYMPTSAGGLVGNSKNINIDTIYCYQGLEVTADKESEVKHQASTVDNYIVAIGNTIDEFEYKTVKDVTKDKKPVDSIATGIGGLIGTLSGYMPNDNGVEYVKFVNVSCNFNVVVLNGINVGGMIGYFAYQPSVLDSLNSISVGDVDNDENSVYIVGALSVGGMFGKITNSTPNPICSYDSQGNMKTLQVEFGYVNVQTKPVKGEDGKIQEGDAVHAEYVGTFAGTSDSIYEAEIFGNIRLNNEKGGYFGGIVGKLNGSLGKMAKNASEVDATGSKIKVYGDVFKKPKNFNYGGLVGLADATDEDIVVLGSHKYEFTVASLRVSANSNNEVSSDVDHDNKMILLMAHKSIQYEAIISQSGMAKYKDTAENKVKWNKLTNPIISKGSGWSLEYTMFKTMELCEKVRNSPNGEKVCTTIYDAKNILEVKVDEEYDSSVTKLQPDGKILYTIYDHESQKVMYSRLGIATYFCNIESDSEFEDAFLNEQCNRYGLTEKGLATLLGRVKGDFTTADGDPDVNKILKEDIKVHRMLASELKMVGVDEFNKCQNKFNNFRSEKAFLQLLELGYADDDDYNFNPFRLDYYCIKTSNNGVFKFTALFCKFEDEYKYYTNKIDQLCNGEKTVKWSPQLTNAKTYGDRTFSLFDVVGNMEHKIEKLNGEKTNRFWEFIKGIGNFFKDMFVGGIYHAIAKNIWHSIKKLYYCFFGAFLEVQYFATEYITTTYEGAYGFIGNPYSQNWYFKDGILVTETDEIATLLVQVTDNNGNVDYKDVICIYVSTSRPTDSNEKVKITNQSVDVYGEKATDNGIGVGSTMDKYQYYNGKWYVVSYAVETEARYVVNKENSETTFKMGRNWWYQDSDGLYYVAPTLSNEIIDNYKINTANIKSGKTVSKDICFGEIGDASMEGNKDCLKNYDYISVKIDDLISQEVWEQVEESEMQGKIDTNKDIYVTVYRAVMVEYSRASGPIYSYKYGTTLYFSAYDAYQEALSYPYDGGNQVVKREAPVFFKFVGYGNQSLDTLLKDVKEGKSNFTEWTKDKCLTDLKNKYKDKNIILTPSGVGIKREVTYHYYDMGIMKDYFITEIDGQAVAVKELTPNSSIFDSDGIGIRVYDSKNKEWVDLNKVDRGRYDDYYISDNYLDSDNKPLENLQAKHYYLYNDKTNKWGQVDYSYQIENMDKSGAYIMKKISIVDNKNANYHENKFKFLFSSNGGGNVTIFTRYKFDTGRDAFAEVLKNNGLQPSSSQNGWVQGEMEVIEGEAKKTVSVNGIDYKFTEIILFSGNSYNESNSKYVRSYASAKKSSKYKI